jgi:class 3 adenylate cyclase
MAEAQALAKATGPVPVATSAMADNGRGDALASKPVAAHSAPTASLLGRLASGIVDDSDNEELRLRKTILLFASGATAIAAFVWLGIYWLMGLKLPTTIPFLYQVLTALILGIYLKTRNFDFYRMAQLALFLFAPFVIQWSIGSFVNSSGIVLLALLAPVGAMVVYGPRESIPWFAAYVVLTILSGLFDYYLADGTLSGVPMRTVAVFFVLNFTILSSIVYLLLRYFVMTKDMFQADLSRQHVLLREAQEQSEQLLNTILPPKIAQRLKRQDTIADGHPDVTVMFADIVNFTRMAEEENPKEVVAFLNTVFRRFDELAEKHGVDKIKTIGDAYMVAGGLSGEGSQYVDSVVDMALDMLRLAAIDEEMKKYNVAFHIGVATGPVFAGVIGAKRFTYDLWGDTVNIASRITAEATANMILVDSMTYRRLRQRYRFDEGREVTVKGKGSMTIYQLTGKRT